MGADERERAVALVYAVRDGFRYDPYRIDLTAAGMRASSVLAQGDFLADVAKEMGAPAS